MISPLWFWSKNKSDSPKSSKAKNVGVPESKNISITNMSKINEKKAEVAQKFVQTGIAGTPMAEKGTVSTDLVKQLRDATGVSVMQCKKALEEAKGDMDKAVVILRKLSSGIAAKKGDRTFAAGTIQAYIHANGTVGTMVELNCETDFVANNEEFKAIARDIAMHVTATNPKFVSKDDIKEADKKVAMEVFEAEVKGKPEAIRAKILEGKLDAYFAEMVLLNQPFIKNPEMTIQGVLDQAMQKFGEKTAVGRFMRYKILEK